VSTLDKQGADPPDGATDVPLNLAPVVHGNFHAGTIRLEHASGEPVEVTINEGPSVCGVVWAEVIPKRPLEPMTQYVIRVASQDPEFDRPDDASIRFVTGVNLLPEQDLPTPKVHATTVQGMSFENGCWPTNVMTCLNLDDPPEDRFDVEVIARHDGKMLVRWLTPIKDATYSFAVLPDCFELRSRSRTGKRSEPLMLCGDALDVRPKTQVFPVCKNGVFKETPGFGSESDAGTDEAELPRPVPLIGEPRSIDSQPAASSQPADRTPDAHAAQPEQREHGCAAATGQRSGSGFAGLALFFGIATFARSRRQRRRMHE
jgi:hypothetical protein